MKRTRGGSKIKMGGSNSGKGGATTAVWVVAVLVLTILCALTIYTAFNAFFPAEGGTTNNYYYARAHPTARGPGGVRERFTGGGAGAGCEYKLMFFAMESCPHCVQFKPEWSKFSKEAKKSMPKVCVSEHSSDDKLTEKYDVHGYPTVIFENVKTGKRKEYDGPRTSAGLVQFVKENGAA
jgi:hypothetical protein